MPKYDISRHAFTDTILDVLKRHFGEYAKDVFEASPLLGYLNSKTRAANRGSKAGTAWRNTTRTARFERLWR